MLNRLSLAACVGLGILGAASSAYGQVDATSLPAHDTHQGVTVAARPLVTEAAYKAQFGSGHTPFEAGILALEVIFRNDNDKPIRLTLDTMRLLVSLAGQPVQRIEPLAAEDVADRVLLKKAPDPKARRLPLPGRIPTSNRDKNWQEFAGRLRAAGIPSDVVDPKSTVHGFLYFDVDHHYDWLTAARLDVPDIAFMLNNEALFFFQVDLAPALH
jgi:hypothetical protein